MRFLRRRRPQTRSISERWRTHAATVIVMAILCAWSSLSRAGQGIHSQFPVRRSASV